MSRHNEEREFVRHPTHIPIEVQATDTVNMEYLNNVSLGGMAFDSNVYWEQGSTLIIRIPNAHSSAEFIGKVVWCQEHNKHFEVGIQFMNSVNNNTAISKMVDDVCQFEMYKNIILALLGDNNVELEYLF